MAELHMRYVLTAKGVEALKVACEALREIAMDLECEHGAVAAVALERVCDIMDSPGPTASRFPEP